MLNIVVIEDNTALRESLVELLAATGNHVAAFGSAESFWANSSVVGIDILLLDLNLPGEDGISVAKRIRERTPNVGIIMLSARASPDERQNGYDNGADIYLAKPSSEQELTAAINAVGRRIKADAAAARSVAAPDPAGKRGFTLDVKAMKLTGPSGTANLSSRETDLLQAFALAPQNRLATEDLVGLELSATGISKATLGVKIVRLRHKLARAGATEDTIRVVRNWGYQLAVDLTLT